MGKDSRLTNLLLATFNHSLRQSRKYFQFKFEQEMVLI